MSATRSPIQLVADGDPNGVSRCLEAYGGLVWTLASRWLGRSVEAEDLVQDVFIELWRVAERYDPAKSSEATFVTLITRRRLIDRTRRMTRRPAPEPLADWDKPAESRSPEETAVLSEEAEAAAKALEQLPDDHRQVLRLVVMEGRTHREVAEALELPVGTVKTWVRRGLIRVREFLQTPPSATPPQATA
ncbi:MAG: sigma-70 family RNA polymerase sigma factor [Planctomycetota bacterium]